MASRIMGILVGIASLHGVTARVSADAYGLHTRTLLRRRSVPWRDIADLRVHLQYADIHRTQEIRRVGLVLHDGRKRLLPKFSGSLGILVCDRTHECTDLKHTGRPVGSR